MLDCLRPAALRPFWNNFRHHVSRQSYDGKAKLRIGVCVSGGPDSMVLAHLLQDTSRQVAGFDLQVLGFIVDHQARPESQEEAQKVSQWLLKLGIDSHVETMEWSNTDPLSLPNFEGEARRKRYQCLANLTKTHQVDHLFFGHHRDDQIETLLQRCVRQENPTLLGMMGMAETSLIPECEGIRTLRNAEPAQTLSQLLCGASTTITSDRSYYDDVDNQQTVARTTIENRHVLAFAPGGVKIHRPLLPFPKALILNTCKVHSIPYVKDKTNDDPTFTARNAIRVLRSQYKLPRALQTESLLDMCAVSRMNATSIKQRGMEFLRRVSIMNFDLRSGCAILRIPNSFARLASTDSLAAAYVLARIVSLINPVSGDDMPTLAPGNITQQFADYFDNDFWSSAIDQNAPKFTFSKTLLEGIKAPGSVASGSTFWRLSRQPMSDIERNSPHCNFYLKPPKNQVKDLSSRSLLWDHRYWIEVEFSEDTLLDHLKIRPYHPQDSAMLNRSLSKKDRKILNNLLHDVVPGKLRYAVPVLILRDVVFAFPTISNDIFATPAYADAVTSLRPSQSRSFLSTWISWKVFWKVLPESMAEWGTKADVEDLSAWKDR